MKTIILWTGISFGVTLALVIGAQSAQRDVLLLASGVGVAVGVISGVAVRVVRRLP